MSDAPAGKQDVFAEYASFYDTLYHDKDYEAECDFLEQTFREYRTQPTSTVLDLGCGTGGHVLPLASRGYSMTGVDRSRGMLEQARRKAADARVPALFELGDVCTLDLGRTFDAVISMFAVASYQCLNADLLSMFKTARSHLEPQGLFVFDSWFGPAVLTQQPKEAEKVMSTGPNEIVRRVARPDLDVNAHTVEVNYEVTHETDGRVVERTRESHKVRFLFPQEIALCLSLAGFDTLAMGPFMDFSRQPTVDDWNVSVVARAL